MKRAKLVHAATASCAVDCLVQCFGCLIEAAPNTSLKVTAVCLFKSRRVSCQLSSGTGHRFRCHSTAKGLAAARSHGGVASATVCLEGGVSATLLIVHNPTWISSFLFFSISLLVAPCCDFLASFSLGYTISITRCPLITRNH